MSHLFRRAVAVILVVVADTLARHVLRGQFRRRRQHGSMPPLPGSHKID